MKQIVFVIVCALIYGGSLYIKDQQLQKKKGKKIETTYSLRKVTGKPVIATNVDRRAFTNFAIVTGQSIGPNVHASVAPSIATKVKPGALVSIRVKGKKVFGNISSISAKADRYSGLHKLVASFGNRKLATNLYVMNVETQKHNNVLTVLKEAISQRGGKYHAYIIDKDNKVMRRNITVSGSNENYYAITDGLTQGDKVVLSDQRYLKNGEKVNVVIQGNEEFER